MTGDIDGAPFRITVPGTWNGKLIVFAHGYRDKADHPGEVDDRSPFQGDPFTRAALLSQGWAIAGTAYKDNGWAVKEALQDLVALASYFKDQVANPDAPTSGASRWARCRPTSWPRETRAPSTATCPPAPSGRARRAEVTGCSRRCSPTTSRSGACLLGHARQRPG